MPPQQQEAARSFTPRYIVPHVGDPDIDLNPNISRSEMFFKAAQTAIKLSHIIPWITGGALTIGINILANYLSPYPLEDIAPYVNKIIMAGILYLSYKSTELACSEEQAIYMLLAVEHNETDERIKKYQDIANALYYNNSPSQGVLAEAILSLDVNNDRSMNAILQLSDKLRLSGFFFKFWSLEDQRGDPQALAQVLHDRINQILPQLEFKAQHNPPQAIHCYRSIRNMYRSLNATEHQLNKDNSPIPREFEIPSLTTQLSQAWGLSSTLNSDGHGNNPAPQLNGASAD